MDMSLDEYRKVSRGGDRPSRGGRGGGRGGRRDDGERGSYGNKGGRNFGGGRGGKEGRRGRGFGGSRLTPYSRVPRPSPFTLCQLSWLAVSLNNSQNLAFNYYVLEPS